MKETVLHIKNMVCDRCITSVKNSLHQQDLHYKQLVLGKIVIKDELTQVQFKKLESDLVSNGFEIVSERNDKIVNDIKSLIIAHVYNRLDFKNKKLSEILSEELHYEYSHLTNIFTKAEGNSIQNFQNKIRAARIKELLEYDELNISEIAHNMDFGSAAYLSTFFKKETGLSPSQYKSKHLERKSLDGL